MGVARLHPSEGALERCPKGAGRSPKGLHSSSAASQSSIWGATYPTWMAFRLPKVVEERCEVEAELRGLVYPGMDTWCTPGLGTVSAIGWGGYRGSNGMRGPKLQAEVTQFQWAPPMHIWCDLWVDRHVRPDEICHLGFGQINWRANVVKPLAKKLEENEREWLHQAIAKTPNVSVCLSPATPADSSTITGTRSCLGTDTTRTTSR